MELEYIRKCKLLQQENAGHVSTLYHCSTDKATSLCFYDVAVKLKTNSNYDIGGTYTDEQPDFWFYYTTSVCHGFNFLLNLFVLPRRPGCFSLSLPKSYQLCDQIKTKDVKLAVLYGPETQLTFRTSQKDEHVFVKTFHFDLDSVTSLENCVLLVPLTIQQHSKLQLDQNTVRTIKLRHDLSTLLSQKESTDFTLESNTGTKYPVHKLLLAAHSPVLRAYMNNPERNVALEISDDAMNIIVEFLYTGTLNNLYKIDYMTLLGIAEKLELKQLFALAQHILSEIITVDNAIDLAVLAKKYKLDDLTYKIFNFIKEFPEVLTTPSWQSLEDVYLVKQLLKYLHQPTQNVN